jgi:hypothetical protein
MDLNITVNILVGSTLLFDSQILVNDDHSKPQDSLTKISPNHIDSTKSQETPDNLIEEIGDFLSLDPTQTRKQTRQIKTHSDAVTLSKSPSKTGHIRTHYLEIPLTGA